MGKVDSIYNYFSLHDHIYVKPENDIKADNLESIYDIRFIINLELLIDTEEFYQNFQNDEEFLKSTYLNNNKIIKNILDKKIENNNLNEQSLADVIGNLQAEKLTFGRNTYPHTFKELKQEIKLEK
jgi:hypothetical protein